MPLSSNLPLESGIVVADVAATSYCLRGVPW